VDLIATASSDEIDALAAQLRALGHAVSISGARGATQADVCHFFGWEPLITGGEPNGPATVATLPPADDLPGEVVEAARAGQRVIATSSHHAQRLGSSGIRKERIIVMPGAVDTDLYQPGPAGPELRGEPRSAARLLCVRDVLHAHNVVDALNALRRIPNARLFIAGGPPAGRIRTDDAAREIASLAQRVRVADRVFLLGRVPEAKAPDLFRSADAVICTGEKDAPATALKAMASATPVVAYALGGVTDVVTSGKCGVLVGPGRAAALGDSVRELLAFEPRRYAMAVGGLSRVLDRFSLSQVTRQLVNLYRAALTDHMAIAQRL
jgi:D-inositol-3-phosphate glycosyltransferase